MSFDNRGAAALRQNWRSRSLFPLLRRKGAPLLCAASLLLLLCALISFPELVKDSVRNSLLYCITALVPSLFPFMVLSSFAVYSGAGDLFGRCFDFPARFLFRLPSVCVFPIIMSFIGGYPTGARCASLLLSEGKINEEQAGRMLLFCVNPGIAFVVTFLGGGILQSFSLGWLLFWAITLSGMILGILSGLRSPIPEKRVQNSQAAHKGALILSVSDASKSVCVMCACIMLFAGFTALLRGSGILRFLSGALRAVLPVTPMESAALLSFLLEVTGGTGAAAQFRVSPPFYSFGLAFGGLCVHLQVFSFFRALPVRKWKFFLFRVLHGLLAALLCFAFSALMPGTVVNAWAAAGGVKEISAFSGTAAGGLSLLFLCMAFLLITSQGRNGQEEIVAKQEKLC